RWRAWGGRGGGRAAAREGAGGAASQRYAFFLMTVYVGSGLGLLLTTSFLGLRRYLRQRGVKMPASVTGVWLLLGGLLTAGLLLVGAFLPRPSAGSSGFLEWTGLTSPARDASEWAREDGDGTGKDKGGDAKGDRSGKGKEKGTGREGKGREKADDARAGGRDKSGSEGGKGGEGKDGKGGRDKGGGREEKSGKGRSGQDPSPRSPPPK